MRARTSEAARRARARTQTSQRPRASSVQDTGARAPRAQRSCAAANTTHTLRGRTALNSRGAPRSRAVYELVSTQRDTRGELTTKFTPTFHFKNTQVMEATLKKQRHQGALIITGPLVSPALTYLSALSGCRVTRTKDAKFAPQRTIQEKNAFIKSMLQQYANVESFQWWCRVLHEFVKEEPLLRLKLHLSVYTAHGQLSKHVKNLRMHLWFIIFSRIRFSIQSIL